MSEPKVDTGADLDLRILDRCIRELQQSERFPNRTYQWIVLTMLRRIVHHLEELEDTP